MLSLSCCELHTSLCLTLSILLHNENTMDWFFVYSFVGTFCFPVTSCISCCLCWTAFNGLYSERAVYVSFNSSRFYMALLSSTHRLLLITLLFVWSFICIALLELLPFAWRLWLSSCRPAGSQDSTRCADNWNPGGIVEVALANFVSDSGFSVKAHFLHVSSWEPFFWVWL